MQDKKVKMERLAGTFPCMGEKPGIRPWDANWLTAWVSSDAPSHGERVTASFLLAVWNPYEHSFDLMDALGAWDQEHRAAFLKWAAAPWWP